MECNICNKQVNEMTLFCDNCGAQLLESKTEMSLENIDELITPMKFDNRFHIEFEDEIRKAYYLSQVSDVVSGESLSNLKEYFDYFYLRLMYEEDKLYFLEEEYSKNRAKNVLIALKKNLVNKKTKLILKEKFNQNYKSKNIPNYIIDRVPNIYIMKERKIEKILRGRDLSQIVLIFLFSFFLVYIVTMFFSGFIIGYNISQNQIRPNINREFIEYYLRENPMYFIGPIFVSFIWALLKSGTFNKIDMMKHLFNRNKTLRKQIRKEVKPLLRKVKRRKQK